MDKEEEGNLPFLYNDSYRKLDGFLGHIIYWKPTHTSLYLHQDSHHHPASEQSVLAPLTHIAKALCDQDSLLQEQEFLIIIFKKQGYSPQQI